MASEGGSSSAVVAIFAILLLTMLGGFIAWQAGVFDDSGRTIDVNIQNKK